MDALDGFFWDNPGLVRSAAARDFYRRVYVRSADQLVGSIKWLAEVMGRPVPAARAWDSLFLHELLAAATADEFRRFLQIPEGSRQWAFGRPPAGVGL